MRSQAAPAAASAMTKSRCRVRARRLGRLSHQGLLDAASLKPKRRVALHETAVVEAVAVAITTAPGFLPVPVRSAPAPEMRLSSPAARWLASTAPVRSARMARCLESDPSAVCPGPCPAVSRAAAAPARSCDPMDAPEAGVDQSNRPRTNSAVPGRQNLQPIPPAPAISWNERSRLVCS